MTEAASLLYASRGWQEIAFAAENGRLPQSIAAVVPAALQELFVESYGKLFLGEDALWSGCAHPDLIQAGKFMTSPSIDECRLLLGELALRPLSSAKRLAIVWNANKLSLPAANSLLKLTEEPPKLGGILFVSEEDKLIPTIKSRVWSIHIDLPEELVSAKPHPQTPADWASWLERSKKAGTEVIFLEIESWIKFLTENGEYAKAANLETLVRVMRQKSLSASMIQDLTHVVLKEGIACDEIFGNIW